MIIPKIKLSLNVKKYFEELSNKKGYLPKKIKANKTEIGN